MNAVRSPSRYRSIDVGLLAGCERRVLTGQSSFSMLASWFASDGAGDDWVFPGHSSPGRRLVRMFRRWRLGRVPVVA